MLGLLVLLIISACFYFYGFIKMGKSVDSKLLRVAAIMNIISVLFFVALMVFMVFVTWMMVSTISTISSGLSSGVGFSGDFEMWGYLFYLLGAITLVFVFVSRFLFSVSLIRIRKKVRFSMIAGITGLVVAVLLLVLYGISFYSAMSPFGFFSSISWLNSLIEYEIIISNYFSSNKTTL